MPVILGLENNHLIPGGHKGLLTISVPFCRCAGCSGCGLGQASFSPLELLMLPSKLQRNIFFFCSYVSKCFLAAITYFPVHQFSFKREETNRRVILYPLAVFPRYVWVCMYILSACENREGDHTVLLLLANQVSDALLSPSGPGNLLQKGDIKPKTASEHFG